MKLLRYGNIWGPICLLVASLAVTSSLVVGANKGLGWDAQLSETAKIATIANSRLSDPNASEAGTVIQLGYQAFIKSTLPVDAPVGTVPQVVPAPLNTIVVDRSSGVTSKVILSGPDSKGVRYNVYGFVLTGTPKGGGH